MLYALSIISLIIAACAAGYAYHVGQALNDFKHRLDDHHDDQASTLRHLAKEMEQLKKSADDSDDIEDKIERIVKRQIIENTPSAPSSASDKTSSSMFNVQSAPSPDGFFGAPKGDAEALLFNNQYDEMRDECFFRVHYISPDEAEFQPIDLARLKSLPSIVGIIRYQGCPLREANGFQLISKGIAKRQNNYWIVESPIQLQTIK